MATATETRKRHRSRDSLHTNDSRRATRRGSHDITFELDEIGEEIGSWWSEGPLVAALLPALGGFLFGTEYLQDVILFLCVGWWLHVCIRVPWSLYETSRPRPIPKHIRSNMSLAQLQAESRLRSRSLSLLALSLLAPVFGLLLLQYILRSSGAYAGGAYITYFHGGLFVLFGGVRPVNHLASLIAGGTRELQGRVHHPMEGNESELELKVERMEALVGTLVEKLREQEEAKDNAGGKGMLEVQDSFEKTASRLEDAARRRERKAEMELEGVQRRVEGLEKMYDGLLSMTREKERLAEPTLRGLVLKWLDWLEGWLWVKKTGSHRSPTNSHHKRGVSCMHPPSKSSTSGMPRRRSYETSGAGLDTVLEEAEFDYLTHVQGVSRGEDASSTTPLMDTGTNMPSWGVRRRTRTSGEGGSGGYTRLLSDGSKSKGRTNGVDGVYALLSILLWWFRGF